MVSARARACWESPLPAPAVHPRTGLYWLSVIPTVGVLGLPGRPLGSMQTDLRGPGQGPGCCIASVLCETLHSAPPRFST